MGPGRRRVSRRTLVAGLAAGAVVGAAFGIALLSSADPRAPVGPMPAILHAAPAIVDAGTQVRLGAATVCAEPEADPCRIAQADAFVRPAGVAGWTEVGGRAGGGGFTFTVPAQLVPPDGFAYWLRFTTGSGSSVTYPPGGQVAPLRVVTTSGLPLRHIPGAFSWDRRRAPDGAALRLRFGSADGQVGRTRPAEDEPVVGPSSFDVAADGSIDVVDWVNRRVERFTRAGSLVRAIPLPSDQPMDIAVRPDGGLYLAELGMEATV